ncbi:hypothetical protein Tco_0824073 [Tanacetum coccineum]|uniref:RNA-directed DNA polymerase, eukaryota, reverse transcriptase zinc-binding domain protein n=1 Tax=Tanacetum coccineum TaxID=301880 RepID=A0ABQ5APR6_9ASTR
MTFPNRLNSDQIDDLERNVTKEEIKRAVWDCGTDKSLSLDGFTFGFYRSYWDSIEKDVVDGVSYFFTEGTFPKGGNASFIALIPKMLDAKVVKDYRPISLIGIMESLHLSFQNVVNEGLFKGVSVSSSLQLSHLFYTDDVIFLGQWSDSNITTIVHALECFHKASGLRMNLHKSKLMGIAVEDEKVSRAAMKMGCCTLKTSFSYLGIKVGGTMSRIKSWDEIVANLHSRLSKWKKKNENIIK